MLPFADSMFPDRVLVRRAGSVVSPQGGVSPSPDVGAWCPASVQWKAQAALLSNPSTPLAKVDATIFIPRDSSDLLIPSLVNGDQIDVAAGAGVIVTTVQAPATGSTDPFIVWEIPVQAVQGGG
jgi:hypothetical protein